MHLLIPFAALNPDTARQVLQGLQLPQLGALLARLDEVAFDEGDETLLSPPHERALARLLGWQAADGLRPWAAHAACAAGIAVGEQAWGLLTPVHLQVDVDQIRLLDPASLRLDEAASHRLFEAVQGLFESEGFTIEWLGAGAWLVAHPSLQGLPTASLDRVIGRGIDDWLPAAEPARLLRRLQNEVQMLLHGHPVNEERTAQGLPPVNSFWVSGCGRAQHTDEPAHLQLDARLRAPALAGDIEAWTQAWSALDQGPISTLVAADQPVTLTLCGERNAATFATRSRSLWQRVSQRWHPLPAAQILERL